MADKKKIKEIGRFLSYENAWNVTFTDGTTDSFTRRVQKLLKTCETKEQEVEFQVRTYLLDKDDVKKLQSLA